MRLQWTKRLARGCAAMAALATTAVGQALAAPIPGGYTLQPAATEHAVAVHEFHDLTLWIITAIVIFVLALLLWVIVRYNAKANPVPKKFTHNTVLEVLWTVVPVLILVGIAFKSFPLLYSSDVLDPKIPESEIVDIKVYGEQWDWVYQYGTGDDALEYTSNMIPNDQIKGNQIPNLSTDNPMVAPVGKYVRLSVSAKDVIHAWAMPEFAIKVDAVPGRLNQLHFKTDKVGIYYGQCSELCGRAHAFMPIELRVLPQDQYDTWLTKAKSSLKDAREYLAQVQPEPQALPGQLAEAH